LGKFLNWCLGIINHWSNWFIFFVYFNLCF